MTPAEIKEQIDKAAANDGRLFIREYEDSKGNVSNKTVRLMGEGESWNKLVEESLPQLASVANTTDVDSKTFEIAREEIRNSYEKTLEGAHAGRATKITYEAEEGDHRYVLKEGREDQIVVFNMIQEDVEYLEYGSATPRNKRDKTIAKEAIKKQLPTDKYIGQLILSPDKVAEVRAI